VGDSPLDEDRLYNLVFLASQAETQEEQAAEAEAATVAFLQKKSRHDHLELAPE